MPVALHHPIPNLFPDSLEQSCTNVIIGNLFRAGKKIEREAKRRKRSKTTSVKNVESGANDDVDLSFVDTDYFVESVNEAREYLVSFLASNLLDKLSSSMTTASGNRCRIFLTHLLLSKKLFIVYRQY